MIKYTFIANFRGGTYISQVCATRIEEACIKWANAIDAKGIQYFGEKSKIDLIAKVANDIAEGWGAALIDGTDNVWFLHSMLRVGSFFVNIVAS